MVRAMRQPQQLTIPIHIYHDEGYDHDDDDCSSIGLGSVAGPPQSSSQQRVRSLTASAAAVDFDRNRPPVVAAQHIYDSLLMEEGSGKDGNDCNDSKRNKKGSFTGNFRGSLVLPQQRRRQKQQQQQQQQQQDDQGQQVHKGRSSGSSTFNFDCAESEFVASSTKQTHDWAGIRTGTAVAVVPTAAATSGARFDPFEFEVDYGDGVEKLFDSMIVDDVLMGDEISNNYNITILGHAEADFDSDSDFDGKKYADNENTSYDDISSSGSSLGVGRPLHCRRQNEDDQHRQQNQQSGVTDPCSTNLEAPIESSSTTENNLNNVETTRTTSQGRKETTQHHPQRPVKKAIAHVVAWTRGTGQFVDKPAKNSWLSVKRQQKQPDQQNIHPETSRDTHHRFRSSIDGSDSGERKCEARGIDILCQNSSFLGDMPPENNSQRLRNGPSLGLYPTHLDEQSLRSSGLSSSSSSMAAESRIKHQRSNQNRKNDVNDVIHPVRTLETDYTYDKSHAEEAWHRNDGKQAILPSSEQGSARNDRRCIYNVINPSLPSTGIDEGNDNIHDDVLASSHLESKIIFVYESKSMNFKREKDDRWLYSRALQTVSSWEDPEHIHSLRLDSPSFIFYPSTYKMEALSS